HLVPLLLGCREACEGCLDLHVHPGVDGDEFSTAGRGLGEGHLGGALRHLGTVDTNDHGSVLVVLIDAAVLADNHHGALRVGYHSAGDRTHDHAGESTQSAGSHDDHGDGLGHFQEHVDRTALGDGVSDLDV